jgi:hypothetical protein
VIALWVLAALGPCAELPNCTAKLRAPAELQQAGKAALALVRFTEGEPKAAPQKIEPKVLRGDVAFTIEVEPKGDELVVRALSQHRPPSVYGLARVKPQKLGSPKFKARAVEIALRGGIEEAMTDLAAQLAEGAGQGRRTLKLSLRVNGLDGPTRQYLVETYVPCLKGQFDLLGAVTEPREVAGYLEDELEYAPANDEPREPLEWQVSRLREATVGRSAQCRLPPKRVPVFKADTVNRGVLIELR